MIEDDFFYMDYCLQDKEEAGPYRRYGSGSDSSLSNCASQFRLCIKNGQTTLLAGIY